MRGQPARDAPEALQPAGPAGEAAPPEAAKAGLEPQGGVVLDEANDLLVITQAGTFIGPAARGWAEAAAGEPATLSRKAASWAQEILAAGAQSESAGLEDPAAGSNAFADQPGTDESLLRHLDWIDW